MTSGLRSEKFNFFKQDSLPLTAKTTSALRVVVDRFFQSSLPDKQSPPLTDLVFKGQGLSFESLFSTAVELFKEHATGAHLLFLVLKVG